MKAFVGVDLGGTNLRAGVVNLERGTVLALNTVPTQAREGPEAVMARMADLIKAVIQGMTTSIGKLVDYNLNKITPEVICEAARQGDLIAKDIYEQVGTYIGIAVANVLVSIGPRKVVIGGGVAAADDLLLEPVRRAARERVHIMPTEEVEIVQASLGLNAGVLGAAMWAAHNLDQV